MIPTEFVRVPMRMGKEYSMGPRWSFLIKSELAIFDPTAYCSRIHIHRTHYTTHPNEKPLKEENKKRNRKEKKKKKKDNDRTGMPNNIKC